MKGFPTIDVVHEVLRSSILPIAVDVTKRLLMDSMMQ